MTPKFWESLAEYLTKDKELHDVMVEYFKARADHHRALAERARREKKG